MFDSEIVSLGISIDSRDKISTNLGKFGFDNLWHFLGLVN